MNKQIEEKSTRSVLVSEVAETIVAFWIENGAA